MVFYTQNVFTGLLLLGIWAIDLYLMMVSLRLFLGLLGRQSPLYTSLSRLTWPAFNLSRRLISKINRRPPGWICWSTVYLGALALRHILIILIQC